MYLTIHGSRINIYLLSRGRTFESDSSWVGGKTSAKRDLWTGGPKGPIKLLVKAETKEWRKEMHNRGCRLYRAETERIGNSRKWRVGKR